MSQPCLTNEKNVLNNQWILILVRGDKLSRVKIMTIKKHQVKLPKQGPTVSVEH